MSRIAISIILFTAICAATLPPPASRPTSAAASGGPDVIILKTKPADLARDELEIIGIIPRQRTDKYDRRADLTVDGRSYAIYLPKAKSYMLKNSGRDDTGFNNKATKLYVDYNANGVLDKWEGRFANLPLRCGARMFDIIRLDRAAGEIALAPSRAALAGAIVGEPVPPFRYMADDGQVITPATYAGKAFLLDIWSVT